MSLDPSLIKHELDGDEYETASPTLGTLSLAHFSTPDPEQHNSIIYGADGLFFATHPERRLYLREAFPAEWDHWTTMEEFQQRPKLWILVSLLYEGFHERTPRFRGSKFWKTTESDRDVADVIHEMSRRGGLRVAEWYGFICDQRVRKADAAKQRSKRNRNVN